MEERSYRAQPRKRFADENEYHLKVTGIRNRIQWPETKMNGGGLYWKPRPTMDCSACKETAVSGQ